MPLKTNLQLFKDKIKEISDNNLIDLSDFSDLVKTYEINDEQLDDIYQWMNQEKIEFNDSLNQTSQIYDEKNEFTKYHSNDESESNEAFLNIINNNIGLVDFIARKYQYLNVPIEDIIQDGYLGLIEAIKRFDVNKGFKFSTYASWWIRSSIQRSYENNGRMIRIPSNVNDEIYQLKKAQNEYLQKNGENPSDEELAKILNKSIERISELKKYSETVVSIDVPIGEEKDTELSEILVHENNLDSSKIIEDDELKKEIELTLEQLDYRSAEILKLRFGLIDGQEHTLDNISKQFNISIQRVDQICANAIKKIKNMQISQSLREFLKD